MPNDFIDVATTEPLSTKMRRFLSMLREVRDVGEEINGVFGHAAADPDYSGIETLLGLTAGEGVTTYNLFVSAYARLNHTDVTNLIDRVITK